ncbi:MAG: ATP-binding cassette domain-containing protein [Planctomycetes bacterium]|nr:ATP-binding cassette domain-containing protein [Planctomycetota bacterium]
MDGPVIIAEGLAKTFRVFDRRPGVLGALRDVFDRRYRELAAVAGIDLTIARGDIIGYIGPNGAGKSTTIKMLTGILTPTRGRITVNGFDPHRQRAQYVRTVGAVFGQRTQLWWDLAVGESFELLRHLYDVPIDLYRQRLARFDQVLELGEFLRTPVRKLSLGQRMKADIAASLLHAPPVLFLDEPTVGVDVATKARLRTFLLELNREQATTILLTTHDMQDIEALCRRVVVIDHGRIMHDGDLDALKARYGARKRLRLSLRAPGDPVAAGLAAPGISWETVSPLQVLATLGEDVDIPALLAKALAALPVGDVQIEEPTIEQVVQELLLGESVVGERHQAASPT